MHRTPLSLAVASLVFFSCGPQLDPETGDDGELGESAVALTLAPGAAEQILALVNHPGTELATLDGKAGLDVRASKNIIARRNGADGVTPSSDDARFATIAQLDAVAYVGDVAFQKLLAFAKAHPAPANEQVEGVAFRGWEAEAVVWGVNHAPAGTLDGMLEARAAKSLIAGRPFGSVGQMGPLAYVGPSALERLRREAATWWRARSAPATALTLAEVKSALEAASKDVWMPSETDAHFLWLQGTQLSGAAMTPAVVRAQLTAQHDVLISSVMYTDPNERSLAAKTFVEERDAASFFGRLINNVDPNDPVSLENAQKMQALWNAVQQNLTDVKVIRFGTISISTFIVGRAPSGELVGLLTGQVET